MRWLSRNHKEKVQKRFSSTDSANKALGLGMRTGSHGKLSRLKPKPGSDTWIIGNTLMIDFDNSPLGGSSTAGTHFIGNALPRTRGSVEKIFFDLDGVLADFEKGVRNLCGFRPIPQSVRDTKADGNMWDAIRETPHFYARLEIIPFGKKCFDYAVKVLGTEVEILTAVPNPNKRISFSAEDKLEWVRKNISPDIVVHTVLRAEKAQFATPSSILVDDYVKNTREWSEAGGIGFLFTPSQITLDRLVSIVEGSAFGKKPE